MCADGPAERAGTRLAICENPKMQGNSKENFCGKKSCWLDLNQAHQVEWL